MGVEPTLSQDAKERLTADDLQGGGMLVASHIHRYEFAASLCRGASVLDLGCGVGYGSRILARDAAFVLGVDVSKPAVDAARDALEAGGDERITFECDDALEFLRRQAADQFEVVVCFEAIEHVPDPDAVIAELKRFAEAGARLVLSLPNSHGFDEQNEFHVTDYGYEEMRVVAEELGAVVVDQYLAEASLLQRSGDRPSREVNGRLTEASDEDVWANHWLLLVGVPDEEVGRAQAMLELAVSANHNQYMRQLEQANAELWRTNFRLGRSRIGTYDAAAAVVVRRFEEQVEALESELRETRLEVAKWRDIAAVNDWERKLLLREADRGRYRVIDAVFARFARLPLVGRAARGGYREATRLFK